MKTNVLVALKNILENSNNELINVYKGITYNRANNMGDALEYFVKDLFCSSLHIRDFCEKDEVYSEYLSYSGNSNNPPDFIIKQSSAVEVKKIEKLSFGDIALNSSHPKDYLYSDSTLINKACRICEDEFGGWTKKEMLYVIGNVIEDKLRMLWFLDGSCYCAEQEVYMKVKNTIHDGVRAINGVEFENTKELAKVKKIDALGITNLRVRGMWSIKHPMKVFTSLVDEYDDNTNLQIYCLILKEKYDLLPKEDKECLKKYIDNNTLIMNMVRIKNPNNPVKFLDAVFFKASL